MLLFLTNLFNHLCVCSTTQIPTDKILISLSEILTTSTYGSKISVQKSTCGHQGHNQGRRHLLSLNDHSDVIQPVVTSSYQITWHIEINYILQSCIKRWFYPLKMVAWDYIQMVKQKMTHKENPVLLQFISKDFESQPLSLIFASRP